MKPLLVFARDALGLPESVSVELSPLQQRGSDRSFFRLSWKPAGSAILVHYDPTRLENAYYADIAEFLGEIDVPVARLTYHDRGLCLIVMEDLGNEDLWSFRGASWETRHTLYRKTLTSIHRLHSFPGHDFPSGRVRLMDAFGIDLYRWERDYFREHFIRGVCRMEIEPALEQDLEEELSALAERLTAGAHCLVHRDLQSQNVMVRDGEPFLIDFQGMRFGNPFYDLGSLLCDPYVNLSDAEREELLAFYYGLSTWDLDRQTFRTHFWEASAQRLMQALGAYGFLGLQKGLPAFLDHVPAGLANLQKATAHAASLPRLQELSRRLSMP